MCIYIYIYREREIDTHIYTYYVLCICVYIIYRERETYIYLYIYICIMYYVLCIIYIYIFAAGSRGQGSCRRSFFLLLVVVLFNCLRYVCLSCFIVCIVLLCFVQEVCSSLQTPVPVSVKKTLPRKWCTLKCQLSGHQIRGRIAVSAAGLRFGCSHERSFFSKTPARPPAVLPRDQAG